MCDRIRVNSGGFAPGTGAAAGGGGTAAGGGSDAGGGAASGAGACSGSPEDTSSAGLLGASTGLALRGHGFAGEIVGWDRDAAALETALRLGALTSVAQEPLSAAKETDLILLAGPVLAHRIVPVD